MVSNSTNTGTSSTEINSMEVNSTKEKADIERHNDLTGIVFQDTPEFINLLKNMIVKLQEIKNQLQPTAKRISSKEIHTKKGISLLDIKYHLMLQYLTHLAFFVHLKLSGRSIAAHPTISTLAEIRVVLEKIRPLEGRLKYQVDKLVRAATVSKLEGEQDGKRNSGAINGAETIVNDPLRFRPNPENLITKADTADENDSGNITRSGLYRPPKLAPVAYDEDTRTTTKQARDQARLLTKAKNSRIVRDLISEMNDMPEEMDAVGGILEGIGYGEKVDSMMQERENYEEENFVRLTVSRKEKKTLNARERGRFENEFGNLEDFGDLVGMGDIEKTQAEQMKNVLVRRNMRNREQEKEELEERGPIKRSKMEGDRLFDGLISDPKNLSKKGKTQFEKAKKRFKAGKKHK